MDLLIGLNLRSLRSKWTPILALIVLTTIVSFVLKPRLMAAGPFLEFDKLLDEDLFSNTNPDLKAPVETFLVVGEVKRKIYIAHFKLIAYREMRGLKIPLLGAPVRLRLWNGTHELSVEGLTNRWGEVSFLIVGSPGTYSYQGEIVGTHIATEARKFKVKSEPAHTIYLRALKWACPGLRDGALSLTSLPYTLELKSLREVEGEPILHLRAQGLDLILRGETDGSSVRFTLKSLPSGTYTALALLISRREILLSSPLKLTVKGVDFKGPLEFKGEVTTPLNGTHFLRTEIEYRILKSLPRVTVKVKGFRFKVGASLRRYFLLSLFVNSTRILPTTLRIECRDRVGRLLFRGGRIVPPKTISILDLMVPVEMGKPISLYLSISSREGFKAELMLKRTYFRPVVDERGYLVLPTTSLSYDGVNFSTNLLLMLSSQYTMVSFGSEATYRSPYRDGNRAVDEILEGATSEGGQEGFTAVTPAYPLERFLEREEALRDLVDTMNSLTNVYRGHYYESYSHQEVHSYYPAYYGYGGGVT